MPIAIGDNPTLSLGEGKVTTYTVNSTSAIDIRAALAADIGEPVETAGIFFRVEIAPGTTDRDVYIRPYEAAQDDTKHGILLRRRTSGNDDIHVPFYEEQWPVKHLGAWSAICLTGSVDIHVIEY